MLKVVYKFLIKTTVSLVASRQPFLFAGGRNQQFLAFVDPVGVRDLRIGFRDALPVGGAAVLRLGDFRQRVAFLNRDSHICLQFAALGRHNNLGSRGNPAGINQARVDGQQFRPTRATAQVFFRQLPERIARLQSNEVRGAGRPRDGGRWWHDW